MQQRLRQDVYLRGSCTHSIEVEVCVPREPLPGKLGGSQPTTSQLSVQRIACGRNVGVVTVQLDLGATRQCALGTCSGERSHTLTANLVVFEAQYLERRQMIIREAFSEILDTSAAYAIVG